jgi:hypothetical protein
MPLVDEWRTFHPRFSPTRVVPISLERVANLSIAVGISLCKWTMGFLGNALVFVVKIGQAFSLLNFSFPLQRHLVLHSLLLNYGT